jgi:hypothetical protein
LKQKLGPDFLELPFATDGLLKGLLLAIAGIGAFFAERKLDAIWHLSAEGFYLLKGIVYLMFAGAFMCLAISRVVRFENRVGRIEVRKSIRLLHLVPISFRYACDELVVVYERGEDRDGRHVPLTDTWKIKAKRDKPSLSNALFGDLAIFSKRSEAIEFMRTVLTFVRTVRSDLPPSTDQLIRLTPRSCQT